MEKIFNKRILALLLSLAVCVCFAFSEIFIAKNVNHSCTHDNCSICQQVEQAEQQIKKVIRASAVMQVVAVLGYMVVRCLGDVVETLIPATLINLKPELLN